MIATHNDQPRWVKLIQAAPDGEYFVASGIGGREQPIASIVAYGGATGNMLWSIDRPPPQKEVTGRLDGTGRLLEYQDENSRHWLRPHPFRAQDEHPGDEAEFVTLAGRYAVIHSASHGLPLSVPGTGKPFLTLGPDAKVMTLENAYTPDGRFVAWGTADGAVHVANMPAIRERLTAAGFPGW
jgi:hypothetical protein